MRKRINGKVYYTGNAHEIAYWDNDTMPNDPKNIYRVLYKTKRGDCFMYQCAGAETEFAVFYKNTKMKIENETIIPLTENEAVRFLIEWGRPDMIKEYFPEKYKSIREMAENKGNGIVTYNPPIGMLCLQ
ncbi:MAG: hypothetical protein WC337_02830 [Candidatus Muiribacteriota bacterium]